MEQRRRSIVKAASYRLFATSLVFLVAFVHTGEFASSAKIGITAAIGKTLLYYAWERLWSNIEWGVKQPAVQPSD